MNRTIGFGYNLLVEHNGYRGVEMQTVTLTQEFHIVIPEEIRESLNLHPGQQFQISENNGRVELIPSVDIASLRGFVKGMNTEFVRE